MKIAIATNSLYKINSVKLDMILNSFVFKGM